MVRLVALLRIDEQKSVHYQVQQVVNERGALWVTVQVLYPGDDSFSDCRILSNGVEVVIIDTCT